MDIQDDTALGACAIPSTDHFWEKHQNRKEALMYAANSFGNQAQKIGLDPDKVLERAKKFEAYLNGK